MTDNSLSQEDLWRLRGMVQRVGWLKLWNAIGSLMAEQAEKVERGSKQDSALAALANFMHDAKVQEKIKDCGFFDYANHPLTPADVKQFLS